MFSRMKQALAVLLAAAMPGRAALAQERAARLLEARARVVLALAHPVPRQVVLLPPGVRLQQVLEEAQALRRGVVPPELLAVLARLPARTTGFPRNTASSARTARRSISKRRRAR